MVAGTPCGLCSFHTRAALARRIHPGHHYVQAMRHREKMKNAFANLMKTYDAVVTTSSMQVACRIDDEPEVVRTYSLQSRTPFNVIGNPALVVPSGLTGKVCPSRCRSPVVLSMKQRFTGLTMPTSRRRVSLNNIRRSIDLKSGEKLHESWRFLSNYRSRQ